MVFKDILRQRANKQQSAKVVWKINLYDVIIRPILTEKTYKQMQDENKYSFQVHDKANKNDVKLSIKAVFGVDPEKVNIINVTFKWRSVRKLVRRAYKKAVITLRDWDKIELVG